MGKTYVTRHDCRDLDDRWSDDGSDATDQVDGLLVDSRAGTVKARVGDHRPGVDTMVTPTRATHTQDTRSAPPAPRSVRGAG